MKTRAQKNSNQAQVIRFYRGHLTAYPRQVLGLAIGMPFTVLINNYLPALILAGVLSRLSQHHFTTGDIWGSFGPQIILYAVLLLSGIGMWRLVDFFMWKLEQNVQEDISRQVFRHMLERSADFHANNFSGSLVSQANKLNGGYVRLADTTIYQVYPMLSGIIIAIIILSPRAPLFALMLGVFAVLYITAALFVSRPVRQLGAKHAALESKQTGFLADAITNVMTIKSFAHVDYENKRFAKTTAETKEHLRMFARAHQNQMNKLGFMNRTISSSALLVAVIAVMKFNANIATVFLIFNYTATIVEQLFSFSNNSLRNYNRVVGDATDLVKTLSQEPEIKDPEQPEPSRMGRGDIMFDSVTFAHDGADDAVFKNLQLHLKPGEKIGLVGHSGSGKSTFTRLLLRFSDVLSGRVLIDGQDISKVTQADLHRQIAYVPQEPLLFHRTIRENIAYGDLDASDEAVEAAARMASAHDFIMALPQGYDTLVGERGVKLSGGQRQRVAIARAMLKNAPVLVLDEATSALDSESEVLIQAALWKLMEGRTAIVIAHRLSTIQKMDRIVVLDNGKIVEEGSHKELIAKQNGTYAKLWAHQSGGFMDD
jgi:ATP-binding cassette subfamily B protein